MTTNIIYGKGNYRGGSGIYLMISVNICREGFVLNVIASTVMTSTISKSIINRRGISDFVGISYRNISTGCSIWDFFPIDKIFADLPIIGYIFV